MATASCDRARSTASFAQDVISKHPCITGQSPLPKKDPHVREALRWVGRRGSRRGGPLPKTCVPATRKDRTTSFLKDTVPASRHVERWQWHLSERRQDVPQQYPSEDSRHSRELTSKQSGIPTAGARYQADSVSLRNRNNHRIGESVGQLCPGERHSLQRYLITRRAAQTDKLRKPHPRLAV